MTITLHLSALSCTFCTLDQFSTTLTAVWVSPNALRGTISATVVSSIGNLSTRHFSGDGDVYKQASMGMRAPSFPPKSKLKHRDIFATATHSKPASKAWKKKTCEKCLFCETREMLLLAYDSKIISDEEFLVLWESCRSKNPHFPYSSYARFDLENIHGFIDGSVRQIARPINSKELCITVTSVFTC